MPSHRPRRPRSPRARRGRSGRSSEAGKDSDGSSRPGRASASPRGGRDPFLGRTVGGYTILERLAAGSLTLTFTADQPAMDRRVLLLVLTDEAADDEATLESFYRTARFAAQVHHPNVVDIYDVSCAEGLHYCAMEHVEGQTAAELVRRRERITTDDAVRVAIETAEALRAGQASGMPGLSLSLDKVVLTSRGEVKLRLPTFTEPDAPPLSDAAACTALGALLYALLSAGRVEGVEEALVPGSPAAAALPPIKEAAPRTPQDVAELVERLLGRGEAEPLGDLDSATAALRDLLAAHEQRESRVRSTTDRVQARRHRQRRMALVAIGAGVVVAGGLIALLVTTSSRAAAVRNAFAQADALARRRVEEAEGLQEAFSRAPTGEKAQAVVARYRQAIEAYQAFIAQHPDTAAARQAADSVERLETFIPVFQEEARRRIRQAAAYGAIRELKDQLDAEIAEKKKTGGTLDLVAWRVRFARLAEAHEDSPECLQAVHRWIDALPRVIQRGQMEIDAAQLVRDFDAKYAPNHNYRGYLAAWEAFREKYAAVPFLREDALELAEAEVGETGKAVRRARLDYHRLEARAKKHVQEGNVQAARAIYQTIVQKFGFESLVARARKALAQLPKE